MNLLPRPASDDDVIVSVRMRRSSFRNLIADPNGLSVPVSAGTIGLIPDEDDNGRAVWTMVVWSSNPTWQAGDEAIPANQASAAALCDADERADPFALEDDCDADD